MVKHIDLSPTDIHGHKLGSIPNEKKSFCSSCFLFFFSLREIQIVLGIKPNFKILLEFASGLLCKWPIIDIVTKQERKMLSSLKHCQ